MDRDGGDSAIHPRWNGIIRINPTHDPTDGLDFEPHLFPLKPQSAQVFQFAQSAAFQSNGVFDRFNSADLQIGIQVNQFLIVAMLCQVRTVALDQLPGS